MFLVGLTGSIATGKSTVSKILQDDCKCTVVDADLIAKSILLPGKPAYFEVIKVFGSQILNSDNSINRNKLANLIFNDKNLQKSLNSITHKRIGKEMFIQILKHFLLGKRFVVLDIPLLIETKFWLKFIKHCVIVHCEPSVQLKRLIERNGYSNEEALNRINSQMPVKEKLAYATFAIDNNNSLDLTKKQVLNFYSHLQSQWSFNLYELSFIAFACATIFFKWFYV